MTLLTDRVRCDHPETAREPLPYDGQPARIDEWQCVTCGHWEMLQQPTIDLARGDDDTVVAYPDDVWRFMKNYIAVSIPTTTSTEVDLFTFQTHSQTYEETLKRLNASMKLSRDIAISFKTSLDGLAEFGKLRSDFSVLAKIGRGLRRVFEVDASLLLTVDVTPRDDMTTVLYDLARVSGSDSYPRRDVGFVVSQEVLPHVCVDGYLSGTSTRPTMMGLDVTVSHDLAMGEIGIELHL